MKIVSKRGYILDKSEFDKNEISSIKKELTVKPYINTDYIENVPEFKNYLEDDTYLFVPICYGISKFGMPDKYDFKELEINDNLNFTLPLRPNQIEAVELCEKELDSVGRCILSAGCGFGKTATALYLICRKKLKALIIVHKTFLLNQWKERIEQFVPTARIGIIRSTTIDIEDKDIIIGMLQSISMKDYDPKIFEDIGMVVVDETHHIGSEVFSRALPKMTSKYMMGLSATPNRKDGLTKVFKWHLGEVAFNSNSMKSFDVIVLRIKFTSNSALYSKEILNFRGHANLPKMINNITGYHRRNILILKIIQIMIKEPNRQGLVLSDRRHHLTYLKNEVDRVKFQFEGRQLTTGFYMGGGTGKKKEQELKESESKDVIFGTFSMAREGLDIPGLNYVIITSPIGDCEQVVGRILRKVQEVNPVVIDIVDDFSNFRGMGMKRYTLYKKNKFIIENMEIKDNPSSPNIDLTPLNNISFPDIIKKHKKFVKQDSSKSVQIDLDKFVMKSKSSEKNEYLFVSDSDSD